MSVVRSLSEIQTKGVWILDFGRCGFVPGIVWNSDWHGIERGLV